MVLAMASSSPLIASSGNLLAARELMAVSLGVHIVLSCLGVALPTFIYVVHRRGLRGDVDGLVLARRWSKVAGVLFAVGAVSGTVLSFEMGLLWPGLMRRFGAVIGLPFALEGIFFFLEAIFLGAYLYGWRGMSSRRHLATLLPVAAAGVGGTFCILAVNSWMNDPRGFDVAAFLATGQVTRVSPWAAMFNRSLLPQFVHMLLAAYLVTAGLLASVYALGWLRGRRDGAHRLGRTVAAAGLAVAAPLQLVSGDFAVRHAAATQPAKFAAFELVAETRTSAPYTLGGFLVNGKVVGAIEIPAVLSLALHGSTGARVTGLDQVPVDRRPPVNVVRVAFQLMVAAGTFLVALSVWIGVSWRRHRRRRRLAETRWLARALVLAGPAALVALEAGWTTTEVGRQPWIARGVLRVADAVTPRGGIIWTLVVLLAVYAGLTATTIMVLRRMSARWRQGQDVEAPYEPVGAAPNAGEATG
jgi:cytochrome bd ubiquinol oxidase subunit I